MQCTACGEEFNISYSEFNAETGRCPKCNSNKGVKPNIVFFNGQARMYTYLYRALDYLEHPNSLLVVIGTMGNVVRIDDLTKRIHKDKKILNNLEKSEFINENNFGKVFYETATTALPKIEEILNNHKL